MSKEARVNYKIRAREARVIGENGEQIGVLPIGEGIKLAEEKGLDLVEVAPNVAPPVCRIMDYSKYKYEQQKKERLARKKQKIIHLKELKIGPKIGDHDYQVKLSYLKRFIEDEDKVKIVMVFRGREMAHVELGKRILDRLVGDCSPFADLEEAPAMEGRAITMIFRPK